MSNLDKPKNGWAKALFILYDSFMGGTNMAKVLTRYDPTFYKFQTRLLEIEKAHPKLNISKVPIPFKSKLSGESGYFFQYTALCPRPYLLNLYNLINKKGLTHSVTEKSKIVEP